MKKLSLIILISLLLSPLNVSLAKTNRATLTNGKTKVAITIGSIEEKSLFKQGFKLYKSGIGAVIPVTPALYESSLASPIGTTDTSMTLVKGTDFSGNTLSGYMCFTLDSGSPSVEYVCGSVTSTAVTGITRGIDPITGVTSVTSLKFSHRRGTSVKITDYPVLSIIGRILNGDDTLPSGIKFNSNGLITGMSTSTPTDQTTAVSLYQFQQATTTGGVNGSPTVKGVWQGATGQQSASSTIVGSTGANLALTTSISTSTAGTAYTIPVTGSTGTIAPGFYQGNNNVWSGTNSFNGTTTIPGYLSSFGSGADGDVTLSASTSLSRDMSYNNLTINTGVILNPNGFRIFVKGTLSVSGTGKIASNGNAGGAGGAGGSGTTGAGGTAGAVAYSVGTLPIPLIGSVGGISPINGNGATGTAGTNLAKVLGSDGVAGGKGGNGLSGNGAGTSTAGIKTGTAYNLPINIINAINLFDLSGTTITQLGIAPSGAGGSAGGGGNSNYGGGGGGGSGSSGGVVFVAAKNISTCYFEAIGGAGGTGGNGTANSGGGGGGGAGGNGGVIILIYNSGSGITTSVAGGTGGAINGVSYSGNANAGVNGNSGVIYTIN